MAISIVMPAYNASPFIAQAIESVLTQSWRDFELIVINDGSTDNTLDLAEKYAAQDARVKVFSHTNKGTAPTLNRGIELASGEWVFLMHADDLMRPTRLERQLAFIQGHPELAVVSCLVRHIDSKNRVIGKDNSKLFTHESIEKLVAANELIGFNHPATALRRSAVLAVGGYRQAFWPAEDIDLWNRLVEKGYKMLVQPEYLLDYRMHGNSASISGARLTLAKVHWLKNCMLRRRAGKPELDLEDFRQGQRAAPLLIRLNRERKDLAKIFYKAAVLHYAQRQFASLIIKLMVAVLLQPSYAIRQVRTKLFLGHDE
ncbi:MAG: glycosyltransferase [Terracidiphilus sp.]|jgi:glycosyltransferase involved in cell wall biosynthesis